MIPLCMHKTKKNVFMLLSFFIFQFNIILTFIHCLPIFNLFLFYISSFEKRRNICLGHYHIGSFKPLQTTWQYVFLYFIEQIINYISNLKQSYFCFCFVFSLFGNSYLLPVNLFVLIQVGIKKEIKKKKKEIKNW